MENGTKLDNFIKTLNRLGYALMERDGEKFTFQKKLLRADLVLVFDFKKKYIDPILFPTEPIMYQEDLKKLALYFQTMREDAEYLRGLTNNTYQVLN